MASRRRRLKKSSFTPVQRIAVVGVCLIALEGIFYAFYPTPKPPSAKDAITKAVEELGDTVDAQRKEQLRIQLAIQQYQLANKGAPPTSLDQLVPTYLASVPKDPSTNQAFEYRVENNRPIVGSSPKKSSEPKVLAGSERQKIDIFNMPEEDERARFVYDPAGLRDPFRVFDFAPQVPKGEHVTPLERFPLNQLRLAAVLKGFDEPQAIVENQEKKGFPVKRGMKIGMNNGVVADILQDKLLILETTVDFTGQKKQTVIEMPLRQKADE